jgi:transcriptional regulator with XRE-family HTH domain
LSIRALAGRAKLNHAHLLRVERGDENKGFSDESLEALAKALGEDENVMFAAAGKVTARLREVICRRPKVFAQLIEQMENAPDHAILRVAREVRDGKW